MSARHEHDADREVMRSALNLKPGAKLDDLTMAKELERLLYGDDPGNQ